MQKISRVFGPAMSLVTVLGTACGDDSSGTGGAGGGASASSASNGTTSSTSATGPTTSSTGGEQGGGGAGGGDTGGGGAGGAQPACSADEPPDAPCEEAEHLGETCQAEVEGGGCPDTSIVWRCTGTEGGPSWYRIEDTHCFCSVESEEAACTALPGCVWAEPPAGTCDDAKSDGTPIPETGCYRNGCGQPGFGLFGRSEEGCHEDLCDAFPPD